MGHQAVCVEIVYYRDMLANAGVTGKAVPDYEKRTAR
jgi:hypothetical protein